MRRFSNCLMTVCLIIVVASVMGCGAAVTEAPEMPRPTELFRMSYDLGNLLIDFSGDILGHQPGAESTFDLTFQNRGYETWKGRYCLELLDEQFAIIKFVDQEIVLEPGQVITIELPAQFPDLSPGAYGLAFVIPDRFAGFETIYVGVRTEFVADIDSWAEPSCLYNR